MVRCWKKIGLIKSTQPFLDPEANFYQQRTILLIIISIFKAFQIYNLLLNILYFSTSWGRNQSFNLKKYIFHRLRGVSTLFGQKNVLFLEFFFGERI